MIRLTLPDPWDESWPPGIEDCEDRAECLAVFWLFLTEPDSKGKSLLDHLDDLCPSTKAIIAGKVGDGDLFGAIYEYNRFEGSNVTVEEIVE